MVLGHTPAFPLRQRATPNHNYQSIFYYTRLSYFCNPSGRQNNLERIILEQFQLQAVYNLYK